MPSEADGAGLAAVLLAGDRVAPALLAPSARELVARVAPGAPARRPPRAPLLLIGEPRREGAAAATADRLRAALPRSGCYVVAPRTLLRQRLRAWAPLAEAGLPAPLDGALLAVLAGARRRQDAAERAANAARARGSLLRQRLELLSGTVQAAATLLDPGMAGRFIMQRAAELFGCARFRLYRLDEAAGLLRLDARMQDPGETTLAEELPLERGLAGWVARTREPARIDRPAADPRLDLTLEWPGPLPRTVVAVPLVSRGRVIGVAELADPARARFGAAELELLRTVMEPAAIALDNALLFRKLEERTVTDDLTHLYNARFMENYLRRETKRAARYGHRVALLFLDLDGFKQVNDVHGHMAGSRTLVEVGEVLRRNVRDIDVVARWGGDEFSVVLPETGAEGAMAMAERIRRRIQDHHYLTDRSLDVRLSVSIGVSAWPENGPTAESLLAAADTAMYRVKAAGKNAVALAPPSLRREPDPEPVAGG
ncbi:MAG: sensor domain-containing diguanylate cyclase [Acidobacteria bacterium]|nr:sensor domain-containing diguanylate cyclase [Acidobacteriota bacterium]